MCRLAAFPPKFPRQEALDILTNFENGNIDGTGSVFVENGSFVVNKWPKPLKTVIKHHSFLDHMPYDGWTVAHLRSASHGGNSLHNTHPFVVGPWAIVHNGMWDDYKIVKLAMGDRIKTIGETDSEVAAHLWNQSGPKKFAKTLESGGVFMGLNLNGELWVVKTTGDLEIKAIEDRLLLASDLDYKKYDNCVKAFSGWYRFDSNGKYIKHKIIDRGFARFGNYVSHSYTYVD